VPDIILHHYPTSPYSEKVRAVLGLKRLAWQSVTIPVVLPKPDLMPLTGGYRKTPVMQIGADIYCDTLLILDEIERRHPSPSIYPASSEGAQKALAWWIERTCFGPAASVIFAKIGDQVPQAFREDRAKFSGRDFDPAKLKQAEPMMRGILEAHFAWAAAMLKAKPFLLGDAPGMADFAGFHILWFLSRLGPDGGGTIPAALLPWFERIKAFGHGNPSELDAKAALAAAKAVEPAELAGAQPGGQVVVMADDTGRDPIQGQLLRADADRIVIRREDPQVGRVNLHFPRAGFILRPA
jgi:glutathione S-transferase